MRIERFQPSTHPFWSVNDFQTIYRVPDFRPELKFRCIEDVIYWDFLVGKVSPWSQLRCRMMSEVLSKL